MTTLRHWNSIKSIGFWSVLTIARVGASLLYAPFLSLHRAIIHFNLFLPFVQRGNVD
jgi:hypothetical protein